MRRSRQRPTRRLQATFDPHDRSDPNDLQVTHFRIVRILLENPDLTQRELADKLGLRVGGLNCCLNALIDKGFVKVGNFHKSKNKFKFVYLLTPQGMAEKMVLTNQFLHRKMKEFDALKGEIEALNVEVVEVHTVDPRKQA